MIVANPVNRPKPSGFCAGWNRTRWVPLSTQVLAEFFWVSTRRLAASLSAQEAAGRLEAYLTSWKTLSITPEVVREAARGAVAHQLPYWDAQLWATARLNQVPTILSEDFAHERRIEGVHFVNPFIFPFWEFVNPFIFPFWEKDAPNTIQG